MREAVWVAAAVLLHQEADNTDNMITIIACVEEVLKKTMIITKIEEGHTEDTKMIMMTITTKLTVHATIVTDDAMKGTQDMKTKKMNMMKIIAGQELTDAMEMKVM